MNCSELSLNLKLRASGNLKRERLTVTGPQHTYINVDGQKLLNFSSNNYLGLASDPRVVESFRTAALECGVGSGASHLISGHCRFHYELEEYLADLTGYSRALVFSTGYMANIGVINALTDRHDVIIQDRLNHASLVDAGNLSRAKLLRYKHCDADNLSLLLERTREARRRLVVTDAVFSMDGTIAPLQRLSRVTQAENAWLMIDDAHGFGILGKEGRGAADHFDLNQNTLPIYMATLGKAIGTSGAFVAGNDLVIETLIQFARPYIYTTAMPAAIAKATLTSLKIARTETNRREHLNQLIGFFRKECALAEIPLIKSETPIQPVVVGDPAAAIKISEHLKTHHKILVTAIRPPTVPEGSSRLRVTLTSSHTFSDVTQLIYAFRDAFHMCRESLL